MLNKYFQIIIEGGIFMLPILVISVVGLAVIAERVYFLFIRLELDMRDFAQQVLRAVESGNINQALAVCHKYGHHPIAKVMNAALSKANRGDKEIQRSMEATFMEATEPVEKRTGYLAMIANISTLLGLLGTISGIMQAFKGITLADAGNKQEVLAGGIATAMKTTAFGLIVAIPCLVAYHFLLNRQNQILDQTQESAIKLLNSISASNKDLRARPQKVENFR